MLALLVAGVLIAARVDMGTGVLRGTALVLLYLFALLLSAYFVRFEMAAPGEQVRTDLVTEHGEAEELERVLLTKAQDAYAKAHPKWRCAGCGEENPHEFEICWSCRQPNRDAI
jgi:hypothetical protein